MATTASLLALVDSAIEALLAGRPVQSYSLPNGASLAYMSLPELWTFRKELTAKANQDSGPRTIRGVASPRTWRG